MAFHSEGALQRRYRETNMEVAYLSSHVPWPKGVPAGVAKVLNLSPKRWRRYAGNGLEEYVLRSVLTCPGASGGGDRWYHVWECRVRSDYPHSPYCFAVLREQSTATLMVTCKLSITTHELLGEFALVSGRTLGRHVVKLQPMPPGDVFVRDFAKAAKTCAFQAKLLESRTQGLQLLFDSFDHPLPSGLCLWTRSAGRDCLAPSVDGNKLVQCRLTTWMDYLRKLSFNELDDLTRLSSVDRMLRTLGVEPAMTYAEYVRRHLKRPRPCSDDGLGGSSSSGFSSEEE